MHQTSHKTWSQKWESLLQKLPPKKGRKWHHEQKPRPTHLRAPCAGKKSPTGAKVWEMWTRLEQRRGAVYVLGDLRCVEPSVHSRRQQPHFEGKLLETETRLSRAETLWVSEREWLHGRGGGAQWKEVSEYTTVWYVKHDMCWKARPVEF